MLLFQKQAEQICLIMIPINNILLQNYNEWATFIGNEDYTANTHSTRYKQFDMELFTLYSTPTGEKLIGHWRGIYKNLLGTDRPKYYSMGDNRFY